MRERPHGGLGGARGDEETLCVPGRGRGDGALCAPGRGGKGWGDPPPPSLDGPPCNAGNEWRDYKTDCTSR